MRRWANKPPQGAWLALCTAIVALCPTTLRAQSYDTEAGAYRSLTPAGRPVAYAEGRGLRLGDFTLHPGLTLGAGFDSNVFFEEDLEGTESAPLFQVMPSLRLETRAPRALRISSNLQLLWEAYASGEDAVTAQNGFDVLGDLGLQIGPRGLASVTFFDVLRHYTDSPLSPSLESRSHLYNEVGAIVGFHPGGADRTSRLGFTGSLGVGYGIEVWDDELDLDRTLILTNLELKYYFFPKTSAFVRASWDFIRYAQTERAFFVADGDPIAPSFEGALVNIDSSPLRLLGGVAGLLTRVIDFRLEGGYGFGRYDSGEDFGGFLAHVGFGLFFTPQARLGIGWQRDFFDSSFSNYYEYDRFYTDLSVTLGDWLVGLKAAFELRRFAPIEVPTLELGSSPVPLYNTGDREDPVFNGTVYVAWNFMEWARVTTHYRFQANFTDFLVTTGQRSGQRQNNSASEYLKHEVFIVTEFEY